MPDTLLSRARLRLEQRRLDDAIANVQACEAIERSWSVGTPAFGSWRATEALAHDAKDDAVRARELPHRTSREPVALPGADRAPAGQYLLSRAQCREQQADTVLIVKTFGLDNLIRDAIFAEVLLFCRRFPATTRLGMATI
jgi:hypothetical protein